MNGSRNFFLTDLVFFLFVGFPGVDTRFDPTQTLLFKNCV